MSNTESKYAYYYLSKEAIKANNKKQALTQEVFNIIAQKSHHAISEHFNHKISF